jgi:hypothetical protein
MTREKRPAKTRPLEPHLAKKLREAIIEHGERALDGLGITRFQLSRAAAGLPVQAGTRAQVEIALGVINRRVAS